MKLSIVILAATAAAASAKRRIKNLPEHLSNVEIEAGSRTGNKVLSKARRLDGGEEFTWIAGYSLKFQSCISYQDYYGGAGGGQGGQYNYYAGQGGQGNYANYNGGQGQGYYNGQAGQYNGQGGYYNGYNEGQYANNAYGEAEENANGDSEEEVESESSAEEEDDDDESSEDEEEDDRRRLEQGYYANYANGYYNGQGAQDDAQGMYQQRLVHFKLCPSNSCYRCKNGADYVVELSEFVDAILEGKMTEQEQKCENVRENCWCDNAYQEEACIYNCFKNAGLEDCADSMYDEGVDLQEVSECSQVEVDDEAIDAYYYNNQKAQNGYYAQNGAQGEVGELFVGPYCSKNGRKINLGVFIENTCSYPAPKGIYEALFYGASLPYAKKSMVQSGCVSCWYPGDNYWEQQEQPEVTEVCSTLYEMSGKCEEGLDGYYPNRDVSGCSFIRSIESSSRVGSTSAKVFAGIFAGLTAILAGVSAVFFKRGRRTNVNLADSVIA